MLASSRSRPCVCTQGQRPAPVPAPRLAPSRPFNLSRILTAAPASASDPPVARRESILASADAGALTFTEGYVEVEELKGCRLVLDGDTPKLEYLVGWKDGAPCTWEPAGNLSEDLVRDYDEKWWAAARKADPQELAKLLAGGKDVLALAVDENKRSALHFAAAMGQVDATKLLIEAGADVNFQDKDGYTPLHMASGYMRTGSMRVLLEAGADPELKDNNGKDVVSLIDDLKGKMPLAISIIQTRLALEEVTNVLVDRLYDEVVPSAILDVRTMTAPSPSTPEDEKDKDKETPAPSTWREFLVAFADGSDDAWVHERNLAPDVIEDWEAGLEYATAQELVDFVQVGTERRFKVQWSDGYPMSWEPEENVPPSLVTLFKQQHPELFEQRIAESQGAAFPTAEYETQWSRRPLAAAAAGV